MALRSSVWDYFVKLNHEKVKCNLCSAVLSFKSNSTSCLNRHFRLKHPTVNLRESRSKPIFINVGSAEAISNLSATVEESATPVPVRQTDEFVQGIPSTCTGSVVGKSGPSCKARNSGDNFRKPLKKTRTVCGKKSRNVKLYKYSDQLSFLKKYFDERETKTNIKDEITNEDVTDGLSISEAESSENEENDQEYTTEANNLETVGTQSPTPHNPKPTGSIQCVMTQKKPKNPPLPNATPSETATATLTEYLITEKESMTCPSSPPLHPVDAFLSGIAPALKKLPPYYWHYAKGDIFAAVQKYEFKMLVDQQQIPESPLFYSELPSPSGSSHLTTSGNEHHYKAFTGQSQQ